MTPFVWKSRIRFVDTDASRRIHYSAIFRHFESAEDEFFRQLGHPYPERAPGLSYPRVHVEADYLQALEYDDEIETAVTVGHVGRSSYTLSFSVTKGAEVAVRGRIVVACMNLESGRSQQMPDALAAALRGT